VDLLGEIRGAIS